MSYQGELPANTLLGNNTSATAQPEPLTQPQAQVLLQTVDPLAFTYFGGLA